MAKKRVERRGGNKIVGKPLDYKKHGDGIDDPNLKLDYDPRFSNGLGMGISRRNLVKAGAAVAGLSSMGAMSSLLAQEKLAAKVFDPVIRIGYIPITDAAALLAAHELGYFKDEGLESVRPTLIRGWSPLVEAFASHRFNLTHLLAPIPIWMRYNNNYPVKVTAWDHTNGSAMVVHKNSGIKSPKDMGGKQFAMPYWYSMHNIVSQMLLKEHGIKPVIRPQNAELAEDECNFLVLNPPDMPPALASRQIDGYCVAEPFCAMGELRAQGEILRFNGDIWKNHPCCVVAMHEQDAMDPERAEWSQKVHNAIVRAQLYLGDNRKEMAQIFSKDGKKYMPFPAEVIERAMMFYDPAYYKNPHAIQNLDWEQDRINFTGWPYPSATNRIVDELKQTIVTGDTKFLEGLSKEHVVNDLFQYDYIKSALEKYPEWTKGLGYAEGEDPFVREEVIKV
ncbi:MAG: ABC transporter substrate-binding protein [Thiohalophilus sp.]